MSFDPGIGKPTCVGVDDKSELFEKSGFTGHIGLFTEA